MLFGHQDDVNRPSAPAPTTAPSVDAPADSSSTGVNPLAVDPTTGVSLPVAPPEDTNPTSENPLDEPSVLDQPATPNNGSQTPFVADPAPTTPFGSDQVAMPSDTPTPSMQSDPAPVTSEPEPSMPAPAVLAPEPTVTPAGPTQSFSDFAANNTSTNTTPASDDLLSIKQQALSQLGPLVSHLDQSPEEKFRTTMMLIQSTDNAALLKDAYDAAQAITDEKVRAQALLDVVNEINYFTQQQSADANQA